MSEKLNEKLQQFRFQTVKKSVGINTIGKVLRQNPGHTKMGIQLEQTSTVHLSDEKFGQKLSSRSDDKVVDLEQNSSELRKINCSNNQSSNV